jgi:hypothetical protein
MSKHLLPTAHAGFSVLQIVVGLFAGTAWRFIRSHLDRLGPISAMANIGLIANTHNPVAHARHGWCPALELAGKVLMVEKKVHGKDITAISQIDLQAMTKQ